MKRLLPIVVWVAAVLVAILPWMIALDSGGVYPWSRWLLSLLVLPAVLLAYAVPSDEQAERSFRPHLLTLLAMAMAGYVLVQTIRLPAWMVGLVSPGVRAAWSQWLPAPAVADSLAGSGWIPMSIDPGLTLSYFAYFVLCAAFAWCGATLFGTRERGRLILVLFAVLGATHSVLGIWQILSDPHETLWGIPATSPFGPFVNRNNASALLLVSLAACLGILGWRLSTTTGHEFGDRQFSFSSLLDLFSDRIALLTYIALALVVSGLIACGSRGGLAGAMFGGALAIGLFRSSSIARRLLAIIVVVGLGVAILFVRLEVRPQTLDRFGASAEGLAESILSDQRWTHWQDTFSALPAYWGTGAGFGTYRYAYLPYQLQGAEQWFVNADNLWLEWILEGGLPALLAILAAAALMIRALLSLRTVHDPMDHGLATAGWCLLGALATGQTFDFGLLMIGAASAAALLAGVVIARAVSHGSDAWSLYSLLEKKLRLSRRAVRQAPLWTGGVLAATLLLAGYLLYREANQDALVRTAQQVDPQDPREIERLLTRLTASDTSFRQAEIHYQSSRLHLLQANHQQFDFVEQLPVSAEWPLEIENSNLPRLVALRTILHRRAESEPETIKNFDALFGALLEASQEAQSSASREAFRALGSCPLAPEPRFLLLQAEVPNGKTELVENLFQQLMQLRPQSRGALEALTRLSTIYGFWDLSSETAQRMLVQQPEKSEQVLRLARTLGHPRPFEMIPQSRPVMFALGESFVSQGSPETDELRAVQDFLRKNPPSKRQDLARHHLLLGRIAKVLQQPEEVLASYEKVIDAEPRNTSHRLLYINYLREIGRLRQAKEYCRGLIREREETSGELVELLARIQKDIDRTNAELVVPSSPLVQ